MNILKKLAQATCLMVLGSTQLVAAQLFEKSYVLLAPTVNDVDVGQAGSTSAGGVLAFGTEIHPQWYAELGFSLAAADFTMPEAPQNSEDSVIDPGVDASGMYFSVLGKAAGQSGELFYKLGVMALGYETTERFSGEPQCDAGNASVFNFDNAESITQCHLDETAIAGLIGIGFDFYVGYRSQVRLYVEHVRGENDLQINSAQLGYRYNF